MNGSTNVSYFHESGRIAMKKIMVATGLFGILALTAIVAQAENVMVTDRLMVKEEAIPSAIMGSFKKLVSDNAPAISELKLRRSGFDYLPSATGIREMTVSFKVNGSHSAECDLKYFPASLEQLKLQNCRVEEGSLPNLALEKAGLLVDPSQEINPVYYPLGLRATEFENLHH
jgi:hypothetical protein